MAGWSSGWVGTDGATAVANGATLTFAHNLGVTDLIFTLYAADDNSGTNTIAIGVGSDLGNTGLTMAGAQIQSVSSTQVTLQLGSSGYNTLDSTGHRVNGSETNYLGKFIKVLALNPLAGPEAAGTEVKFIEPYDITPVDGAWTKIDAQPAWANSNARTLVVKAETYDFDTGGVTDQSLKARTSAASTIEVDIITHGGTSGGRSVASEQALIPCSEDGSFEYFWYRSDTTNGKLRHFKVIGYVQRSPFLTGTGDLCKLFPDDSGYQMFRNGLTMQWMSSLPFTSEGSSQVINFPIPFSAPPLKVTASTRYPSDDGSSQQWIQVATWDATSVTVRAQSQNVGSWTKPIYADIIAIGIAEVTGCSASGGGGGGGGDVDGIKVSQLTNAAELKDDDLFLLSRDNEPDGSYDISKNVKLSDIAKYIAGAEPPTPTPPAEGIVHFSSKIISNASSSTESKAFEDDDSSDITAAGVYEIQSTYAFERHLPVFGFPPYYTRLDPSRAGYGWTNSGGLGKAVPTVARQNLKSMAIPAGTTVKFSFDWTHLGGTYTHHEYTREDLIFFEITGPALIVDLLPGETLPDASAGTHLANMGITQQKVYNWYNILQYPEIPIPSTQTFGIKEIFDKSGSNLNLYDDVAKSSQAPSINSLYYNSADQNFRFDQLLIGNIFLVGHSLPVDTLFKLPSEISYHGSLDPYQIPEEDRRTLRNMPYTSTLIIE